MDIGQSSIKAVRMERSGATAEVTDFDVIEIEQSEDESTRPARVQVALEELVRRRRIGGDPVLVSIPGNQTFFRPFSLPAVAPSRLREIVQFEARQQIPFGINEVLWDYKVLVPGEGGETRVGIVAVRRELVDQLLTQLRALNLRLEAVQVAPVALYNLVHFEIGARESWLVLDAGAKVTDFVIVNGDEFWFRPLPQSGNDFTRALEQKFRMSFGEAEDLKLKMGESKQADKIFQVMEPVVRGLIGDIQRTINHYRGIKKDMQVSRVFAIGNTFRLPGLQDSLSQVLEADLTLFNTLRRIRLNPAIDLGWFREEMSSMAVALGLGLQGLGLARTSLELLPEALVRERIMRRKKPIVAAAAAIALFASLLSYFAASREKTATASTVEMLDEGLQGVETYSEQLKQVEESMRPVRDRVERWTEQTARDKTLIVDCIEKLALAEDARGRPAFGRGVGPDGIWVRRVHVSRDDPVRGMRGESLDRNIEDWYSEFLPDQPGREPVERPMVGILLGEVYGRAVYEDQLDTTGAVDPQLLQDLRRAVENSSHIVMKDGAGGALVGKIEESAEDRKKEVVRFTPRGGRTEEIKRPKIERMSWFRKVTVGTGWNERVIDADPDEVKKEIAAKAAAIGEEPKYRKRKMVLFTLAWVYDDGSLKLPEGKAR